MAGQPSLRGQRSLVCDAGHRRTKQESKDGTNQEFHLSFTMIVPILDKGDAVLIVSGRGGQPIVGYITPSTLEHACKRKLSVCAWRRIVQFNLSLFEESLVRRFNPCQPANKCVEITILDLPSEAQNKLAAEADAAASGSTRS